MNRRTVATIAVVGVTACCGQRVTAQEFDFIKTSGIFVAKGFNVDLEGFGAMTAWRVHVNIGVGNQVTSVFGSPTYGPLDIAPSGGFFQHPEGQDVEMDADLLKVFPTLQWDSYVSIGNLVLDSDENPTQLSPFFPSGSPSGLPWGTSGLATQNGVWYRTPDDAYTHADEEGLVFIGQFTLPQTTHMDGLVNLTYVIDGSPGVFMQETFNFDPVDVNEDGAVNQQDLVLVLENWGHCDCPADVTGDDEVDVVDLITVAVNWSETSG